MRWRKRGGDNPVASSVSKYERYSQQRKAYDDIMATIDNFLLGTSYMTERAAIYDFVIWTLGQEIAADGYRLFVSGKDVPDNHKYDLLSFFPAQDGIKQEIREFDISKIPTYTGLWSMDRFSKSISSVLTRGYRHEMSNHKGIFYKELNFAVMLEGRHHTSWGVFTGECLIPLQIISLEPYFPRVTTDGSCFCYSDDDGQWVMRKEIDYRLAAMYRLAQIKWENGYPMDLTHRMVENRQQIHEEAKKRLQAARQSNTDMMLRSLINENAVLRNEVFGLKQEINYWKQECTAKDLRIRELKENSSPSK